MTFDINTTVSGHFDIYRITKDGKRILESSVPNLITNEGLDMVAERNWVDNFTQMLLGRGTTPAQNTDTALENPIAGAVSTTYSANTNDNSSAASYNSSTGSTTYTLKRTFLYTHASSTTTINEVGLRNTGGLNLFNRAILSPGVTVNNGDLLAVQYTLTLVTDGTKDFNIPLFKDGVAIAGSSALGNTVVTTCPFALINTNGSTIANHDFRIFEPSASLLGVGMLGSTAQFTAHANRRTAFTTDPLRTLPSSNYISTQVASSQGQSQRLHSIPQMRRLDAFTNPTYVAGSYQIHKQMSVVFGANNGNTVLNQIIILATAPLIGTFDVINTSGTGNYDYNTFGPVVGTAIPGGGLGLAAGGLQWFIGSSGAGTNVLTTDKIRTVLRLTWNRA